VANNIGSLAVQITGNSTGLTKALHAAESGVKHSMGKIAAITTGVVGGLFAGFSIGSFVLDSVKIAGEMEDVASSFKTMTGSATEGEALFRDLEDASDAMRMNVKDTAEAAKGLFSADVAADQIVPTLKLIGDLSLGSADNLKTLSAAYAKVVDDGAVSSRTMRAFAGAGVHLASEMAKGMGLDRNEFKEALEDGKVSLRDLQQAMVAAAGEGGKFFGATERRMETFAGKVDALQNMWEDFKWDFGGMLVDELGLKGMVDALTAGLGHGKDNIDSMRPIIREIKDLALEFGEALFKGLANAAIAAAELVNIMNRLTPEGKGIGGSTFGQNDPNWLERNTTVGGLSGQIGGGDNWARRNLSWLGPGGGALAHRKTFGGMMEGSEKSGLDIFDTQKMAQRFKALGTMIEELNPRNKMTGSIWANMAQSAIKAGKAFEVVANSATNADRKRIDEFGRKANPVKEMMKEWDDIMRLSKLGEFGGKGPAFEQALADMFQNFAGDIKSTVQLSSAALKDSVEAVSAISENRTGGRDNLPARAAQAAEQALQLHKQAAVDRGIMARAMIDLADKLKKEALP
jgi:tape measure domain-containing protein